MSCLWISVKRSGVYCVHRRIMRCVNGWLYETRIYSVTEPTINGVRPGAGNLIHKYVCSEFTAT